MTHAHIELTEEEQQALRSIAEQTGRSQEDLIRQAVEQFVATHHTACRLNFLRHGRGMWKDRRDLPDFGALRRELDRPAKTK